MANVPRLSPTSPLVLASPSKSPSRRALIFPTLRPIGLSPVKTPRGRAGLPSPAKRTIGDLDASAVKKAYRIKISSLLADEDDDEGEQDELTKQDLAIAESIINGSRDVDDDRDDMVERYGVHVPLEVDTSDEELGGKLKVVKRGRGRPRKTLAQKLEEAKAKEPETALEVEMEQHSQQEKVPEQDIDIQQEPQEHLRVLGRRVRRRKIKQIISESEGDDLDSDLFQVEESDTSDSDVPESDVMEDSENEVADIVADASEIVEGTPKRKRGRPRKYPLPGLPTSAPRSQPLAPVSVEPTPKRGKTDTEILSIFKQDDEALKIQTPYKAKEKVVEPHPIDKSTLIHDDALIPFVSGIPEDPNRESRSSFQTLPVPHINADGGIPEEYIQRYLASINWSNNSGTEVIDDRAYFSEGPEGFFDQTSHREKHSVFLLSNLGINLSYKEFKDRIDILGYIRREEKLELTELYKKQYHQWCLELSQGFNLCFFGVGSKIDIITDFASNYLVGWMDDYYKFSTNPKVLVLNGYNPSCKLKDILEHLIEILCPEASQDISRQVHEVIPQMIKYLNETREATMKIAPKLVLIVHSIESESLRDERTQVQLCQLANLPEVHLICSFENISTPLLWDLYKSEHFRFLFHDITNYSPYVAETFFRDVINMGKTTRTSSSRGAKFVLSALNANSKKIYNILLTLQVEKIKELNPKSSVKNNKGGVRNAILFKTLHEKCIQQFITSNEISFRNMVTEFVEHNMCKLVKDEAGNEKVYIPYSLEEMNKLLAKV